MAGSNAVISVACVIEPWPNAVIGAWLLRQSLREFVGTPVDFRLTVVARRDGAERGIARVAGDLGILTAVQGTPHANPFLNKWLWLDAFPALRQARRLAMMDWDMMLVSESPFPGPFPGRIGARLNPPGLYRGLVRGMSKESFPVGAVTGGGAVPSSLNGGFLVGAGSLLRRCARQAVEWEAKIAIEAPESSLWEREQLGLSIAVGQIGMAPLPPKWNATWRYRQRRQRVVLWHYSDASGIMKKLKQTLHQPALALGCLRELKETFPRPVGVFLRFYSQAIEQRWFHDLVRRPRPRYPAAMGLLHTGRGKPSAGAFL